MPGPVEATEETVKLVEDLDPVQEVTTEEAEDFGYTADELVGMWSSGSLAKGEIDAMAAAGVISNETYEEFLALIARDEESSNVQSEETSGSESIASNIDTSTLLTTHVIEVEDSDGYNIRETIQLSPIFTEDDMDTVYALWEALGNDTAAFPGKKTLCDKKRILTNYQLEYVIGTCMIENLTDGFPITPDNPRSYAMSLTAEDNGNTDDFFNDHSVSVVVYSNSMVYDSDSLSAAIGDAKMVSDTWGPCTFIIALPNTRTPNQPDGYRYDEIQIVFDYNIYDPYNRHDTFKLEYFKKEVN